MRVASELTAVAFDEGGKTSTPEGSNAAPFGGTSPPAEATEACGAPVAKVDPTVVVLRLTNASAEGATKEAR